MGEREKEQEESAVGGASVPPGGASGSGVPAGAGETIPNAEPTQGGTARRRAGVRGRGTRPIHPERPCLNCGDPRHGEFCPACGQRKAEVLVSVRAMVADVLEDEFVLNRRLPSTLFNLFFRPGFLTVEHVNGRIARYIRPFRLYLLSSIIFFLLLSFFSLRMLAGTEIGRGPAGGAGDAGDTTAVAELDRALAGLDSTLSDTTLPTLARAGVRETRAQLEQERLRTLAARDPGEPDDTLGPAPAVGRSADTSPAPTLGELLQRVDGPVQIGGEEGTINRAVQRRAASLMDLTPRQALERLVGDFLNHIPTMMFILLPLFALVLKLLYIRRRRYYVEHFVFLLHVHAFVYLIFALMLLVRGAFTLPGWLIAILLTWSIVYIFIAMKRVYGQSWLMTFMKGWVLGWTYVVVLAVSIPAALIASILFL